VDVLPFLDVVRTMQLVRDGQLDATLQDAPAATHYARDFPELREAGPAFAPGYYVIFVRKDDGALKNDLDRAIREGLADGSIARIYQHYGLWNADQDRLISLAEHWPPSDAGPGPGPGPGPDSDSDLARYAKTLVRSAFTTVALAGLAMPLAVLLGLITASLQIYGPARLARPIRAYVELVRGTPVLFQLYVIYYVLPEVGLKIPEFWAGVIGLGVNYSAYEAENYRAGFLAIPRGQIEAAWSLGMDTWTALRRVIVPQAARLVLPPVTGDFIALFKDTSVCSVIAVTELSNTYNRLSNDHPLSAAELGLITAALYLLMSLPLSFLTRRLEKEGS
jgi:polar amino acid transport system substrate-binding protein